MTMVGKIVADRFRILRLIGEGGMGSVYEAQHVVLPRRFAIKILRAKVSRDQSFIERFRREAIAASRVEHPNIIYITDFGCTEDGEFFLVMEYLEGAGLDSLLSRYSRLPIHRALPILAQVADALDHAHLMNVVHRDLKPENILLCEVRGQKDFVKLLDFGIAKVQTPEFANAALTVKGQVFGTAEYMSPEQAVGDPVDGRADLYAMGCLAYELLTGDPPFTGTPMAILQAHVHKIPLPPSSVLREHHIPPPLDALVLRCLAKDPANRYQTGAELKHDLLRVRALLFNLSDSIVSRVHELKTPPGPKAKLTDGWRKLDSPAPAVLFSDSPDPFLESGPPPTSTSVQDSIVDPLKLRENYHDVLRELAITLVQEVRAPKEISEYLERLLVLEEEVASLTGTIALAEQNFDRIRFDHGQKEKQLRHAILDLSMAQAQLKAHLIGPAGADSGLPAQIEDLSFQIAALSKRSKEVDTERSVMINELAHDVQNYRQTRQELEQEIVELFQTLHAQVETLRSVATQTSLQELYRRLDDLVRSIQRR
jgi:serine/threonine protein kinase